MKNKGQVWISAVLYIGLSVAVLALILAAGMPLIEKMKDRNTIVQTKQIFMDIDYYINFVSGEGVGSKRVLDPVSINAGELFIRSETDQIIWEFKTESQMIEISTKGDCDDLGNPGAECYFEQEGNVYLYQEKTLVEDEYLTILRLDYDNKNNLELNPANPNQFKGKFKLIISNDRTNNDPTQPVGIGLKIM